MSTISVPLKKGHEEKLDELVKSGAGSSRADVMRKALDRLAEEEAVNVVLRSLQEVKEGKLLKGDLRELAKRIK
jgi:Arc/MetJ-type ribon-helix-helix transcriptional regulator